MQPGRLPAPVFSRFNLAVVLGAALFASPCFAVTPPNPSLSPEPQKADSILILKSRISFSCFFKAKSSAPIRLHSVEAGSPPKSAREMLALQKDTT